MSLQRLGFAGLGLVLSLNAQNLENVCLEGKECSQKGTVSTGFFTQKRVQASKGDMMETDERREASKEGSDHKLKRFGPKDKITVKITNVDHDEEEIHGGPECRKDDDCLHACAKVLPYEICFVQRTQLFCEGLAIGATGNCAATHFMKNNSKFTDVHVEPSLPSLVQGDNIQLETKQGNKNHSETILLTEEDHKLYEEQCDDCVCFGESMMHCASELITDGAKCGWSIVENVMYYGNYAASWLGLTEVTTERTALSCTTWGPCNWPVSFKGCLANIGKMAGEKVGEFVTCAVDNFAKECDGFSCLLDQFTKTTSCQAKLIGDAALDAGKFVEETGAPAAVSNLMSSASEKVNIVQSTKSFANDLVDTLKDEYSKEDNWEDGSMCLPEIPLLFPDDCGAFGKAAKIFTHMSDAHKYFWETVNALKTCASNKIGGMPTPFMKIHTVGRKCLPKFFDTMKDKAKQSSFYKKIEQIRDTLFEAEKTKVEELQQSSNLIEKNDQIRDKIHEAEDTKVEKLQSASSPSQSSIPGVLVLKVALQLRMGIPDLGIAQGLDVAIGVKFHLSKPQVDFFLETAFIIGAGNLLKLGNAPATLATFWQTAKTGGLKGPTIKAPRMAVVLAYVPGNKVWNGLAINKPFQCWDGGPKCKLGEPQIVVGSNIPLGGIPQVAPLLAYHPSAGVALAGNSNGGVAMVTNLNMALMPGDVDLPPPPLFGATKIPMAMTWSWKMDELCTNTCRWKNDNECDDGGEGSAYSVCDYGTDCQDCGARKVQGA